MILRIFMFLFHLIRFTLTSAFRNFPVVILMILARKVLMGYIKSEIVPNLPMRPDSPSDRMVRKVNYYRQKWRRKHAQ